MTTPVTQVEKNGNMTMQFYLPQNLIQKMYQIQVEKMLKL